MDVGDQCCAGIQRSRVRAAAEQGGRRDAAAAVLAARPLRGPPHRPAHRLLPLWGGGAVIVILFPAGEPCLLFGRLEQRCGLAATTALPAPPARRSSSPSCPPTPGWTAPAATAGCGSGLTPTSPSPAQAAATRRNRSAAYHFKIVLNF